MMTTSKHTNPHPAATGRKDDEMKSIQINGYYDMDDREAREVLAEARREAQQLANESGQTVEIYDEDVVVDAVHPEDIEDDEDDEDVIEAPSVDRWIVPPENQGQIVEISYGVDDDGEPWRKCLDTSDRSVTYSALDWSDIEGEWEPWTREPSVKRAAE